MTPLTTILTVRAALTAVLALAALAGPNSEAHAVSASVKLACASDYFAYCSQHSIGGPGVRQCMRANGTNLSKRCINALVAAGEVSAAEVARRTAAAAK
jgi:hypothetical protein